MDEPNIRQLFAGRFGNDYLVFRAPGRINLIGEHTDYNLGYVLPAAINQFIYLAIHPNETGSFHIHAADLKEDVSFDRNFRKADLPGWARYPAGVVRELSDQGFQLKGFNAVFGGNIPTGAGLSSSAALESAFALALNYLNNLGMTPSELAKAGQQAEHHTVGVRCGIMDQFASVFGKSNQLIRLDCRDLSYTYFPLESKDHTLLLANTKVSHSLAESAYNERREQCEEGMRLLAKKFPGVRSLRDVSPYMLQTTEKEMDPVIIKRCQFVTEENERVLKTCEALEAGDLDQTGKLIRASHEGLRHKYEVSCSELDLMVETSGRIPGVKGARMMGGGFGGCTINLLETRAVEIFKSTVSEAFYNKFRICPEFYDVNIANGATLI